MSDEQEVLAANKAFYRAFEKKDLEAMSAVWSKGTARRVYSSRTGGDLRLGRGKIVLGTNF
ncbi:hypothetical protein ACL6C3_24590 [Capilliphycus salinus ALCB114379]|uniref:hypothetical protein n=1 Tax=Capilliphycus salinus TaxID=2768948 RepID=UPI0039A54302